MALLGVALAGRAVAGSAPAGDPVAVVASVKGRVDVAPSHGGVTRATFGRPLERGDKVTVGAGGAATLFFADGTMVTLSERGSLTIGSRPAAAPVPSALPSEVFEHVSRFATAGSRQTGLVTMADMRGTVEDGAPLLLEPRNSSLLEDAPALRWRTVPGATHYRVHLAAVSGAELWTRDVPAATGGEQSLDYPADAQRLAAGVDYEWEVEVLDDRGAMRREGTVVRVLSREACASVRANLAHIADDAGGAQAAATHFLSGSYLSGLGVYGEATSQFESLAVVAPESPVPHEALGQLYLNVGLSDRAAAEFQQALALQRGSR